MSRAEAQCRMLVRSRMSNRTKARKPEKANELSSLNGHHERGKDTEENIDGGRKKRLTEQETTVHVELAFSCCERLKS